MRLFQRTTSIHSVLLLALAATARPARASAAPNPGTSPPVGLTIPDPVGSRPSFYPFKLCTDGVIGGQNVVWSNMNEVANNDGPAIWINGAQTTFPVPDNSSGGVLVCNGSGQYFATYFSMTTEMNFHQVLRSDGSALLDPSFYGVVQVAAINNHGTVLGTDSDGHVRLIRDLNVLDTDIVGTPIAINDLDQVLIANAQGTTTPTLIWTPQPATDLDAGVVPDPNANLITPVEGATFTGVALNNLGHVLGYTCDSTTCQSELWVDANSSASVGAPSSTSKGVALNDFDQVILGDTLTAPGVTPTLSLWQYGTTLDLVPLVQSYGVQLLAPVQGPLTNGGQLLLNLTSTNASDGSLRYGILNLDNCIDTDGNGNPDNDGDGLCDNWETDGIDFDLDGKVDFVIADVNKDGVVDASEHADPNHKDVYVEVDWMALHQPLTAAFDMVVQAFANAPVTNPDGKTGVRLHILADEQAIAHYDLLPFRSRATEPNFYSVKNASFGTASERASMNHVALLSAKHLVFHYALFTHKEEAVGNTGIGEIGGTNFEIALGHPKMRLINGHPRGDASQQAATFMHELGHNLGLHHGGSDDENCKPNYLSIMSYSRGYDGNPIVGRQLDYSRQELPALDQTNLNEPNGIAGPAGYETSFYGPLSPVTGKPRRTIAPADQPIDWNLDGDTADLHDSVALTKSPCGPGGLDTLSGFDDWAHLVYAFRKNPSTADDVPLPPDEITVDIAEALSPDTDSDGLVNFDDNCMTVANPGQEDTDQDGVGDVCDDCPTIFNPSQAPCASLPPGGEPDQGGGPSPSAGGSGTEGGVAGSGGQANGDGAAGAGGSAAGAGGASAGSSGASGAPEADASVGALAGGAGGGSASSSGAAAHHPSGGGSCDCTVPSVAPSSRDLASLAGAIAVAMALHRRRRLSGKRV